jgi:hypothetical protein
MIKFTEVHWFDVLIFKEAPTGSMSNRKRKHHKSSPFAVDPVSSNDISSSTSNGGSNNTTPNTNETEISQVLQ